MSIRNISIDHLRDGETITTGEFDPGLPHQFKPDPAHSLQLTCWHCRQFREAKIHQLAVHRFIPTFSYHYEKWTAVDSCAMCSNPANHLNHAVNKFESPRIHITAYISDGEIIRMMPGVIDNTDYGVAWLMTDYTCDILKKEFTVYNNVLLAKYLEEMWNQGWRPKKKPVN